MEACFLSSNSFPKTAELLPTLQSRFATHTRQNSINNQSRKFASPFSVTCSQSGPAPAPSLPPQDETKLPLTSDWRAFRAKLVAKECDGLSLSSIINPAAVDNGSFPIGDRWAHTIPDLEKGCLLIATEKQDGVHIFERTVILILSTGPIGPTGLILNRPSLMSIKEMRSSTLDVSAAFSDRPLFFGGPMEEDGLFLLSPDEKGIENVEKTGAFEEVMKGLYCGRMESVGYAAEMVKGDKIRVKDFRFFDGYCAWEGTQLRVEVRAGYWALAACSPSIIGLTKDGRPGLWEEIIGLISPTKVW